jgi:hypothetical protein
MRTDNDYGDQAVDLFWYIFDEINKRENLNKKI